MTITEHEKFNVGIGSPFKPRDNCIFVVSAKLLRQRSDVLCDSNGVWKPNSGPRSHWFEKDSNGIVKGITKKAYEESQNAVHFKRRAYKNQNAEDYIRIFWCAEDGRCDYVMLQYLFEGEPHDFDVKPHGNAKRKTEAHRRTFPSTLQEIKETGRDSSKTRLNLQVLQCIHVI